MRSIETEGVICANRRLYFFFFGFVRSITVVFGFFLAVDFFT